MGRQLKRVALDFSWPINKTWGGYINPFASQSIECPECGGNGYSKEAQHLHDMWYGKVPFRPEDRGSTPFTPTHPVILERARRNTDGVSEYAIKREAQRLAGLFNCCWLHHVNDLDVAALVAKGRLMDFTHTWKSGEGWTKKKPAYIPTAAEVNEWSLQGMGHDSINCCIVVVAECERLGYSSTCSCCKGHGRMWPTEKIRRQYDRWKATEPPQGDGFQLWENTSEGSPISPVFATLEELCVWAAGNATTFGSEKVTADQWLKMLGENFVRHESGNAVFI